MSDKDYELYKLESKLSLVKDSIIKCEEIRDSILTKKEKNERENIIFESMLEPFDNDIRYLSSMIRQLAREIKEIKNEVE